MRNKTKKWTMLLSAAAMTACLAVALPSVAASAEGETTTYTEIQSDGFYMEKGAQVRLNATNPGIRFVTNVTKAFYDSVFDVYPTAASIEFYTEIDKYGNTDTGEAVEAISTVDFATEFETKETVKYNGAITYENLSADQKAAAYAMELEAYAKCRVLDAEGNVLTDEEGKSVIIGAKRVDPVRSMRLVASAATLDPNYETKYDTTEQGIIEKYLGTIDNSTDFNAYETINEAEGVSPMDGTVATNYTVAYVNSKEVGTVENGVVKFDKEKMEALASSTLGYSGTLTLFDDQNNVYTSEFMYVTQVLTTGTDIGVFSVNTDRTEHITGYYVLGNNIQTSKTNLDQDSATSGYQFHTKYGQGTSVIGSTTVAASTITVGFVGTLDGRGYQWRIEGPGELGIFAYLGDGAVIKNIKIESYSTQNIQNRTYVGNSVLAYKSAGKVTLENVYVKISHNAFKTSHNKYLIYTKDANLYMNNVVVENTVYNKAVVGGVLFHSDGGRGSLVSESYQNSRFQNVYVIAGTADDPSTTDEDETVVPYMACWHTTAWDAKKEEIRNIVAGNDTPESYDNSGTMYYSEQYNNIKRYVTLEDLYATFTESNPLPWNLVDGALVWNQ